MILKERTTRVKACCGGVYMLKNMQLVILVILLNPSFKVTTGFANTARTIASTSEFIY